MASPFPFPMLLLFPWSTSSHAFPLSTLGHFSSSSILTKCYNYCFLRPFIVLQQVLSSWSILFVVTTSHLSFWLILSIVVAYPLEVVLLAFGTGHLYGFTFMLVLVLNNSLFLPQPLEGYSLVVKHPFTCCLTHTYNFACYWIHVV
jgi:hypothetical protein